MKYAISVEFKNVGYTLLDRNAWEVTKTVLLELLRGGVESITIRPRSPQ